MRLLSFVIIFLPVLLSAQADSASALYGEGVRAYYAEDYRTALQKYSGAIYLRPNTIGYLYSRGLAYRKLYQDSLADIDFLAVTRLDPRYLDAWYELGMGQIERKNYDSAFNYFSQALRISPGDVRSMHQLGLVYYYKRRYFDAIDIYTRIIQISPGDEQAYYKRGLAKFNDEDYDGAIKDFSESYHINPDNTLALEQRAMSYLRANDLDGACRDWHILLEKGNPRVRSKISLYCGKN